MPLPSNLLPIPSGSTRLSLVLVIQHSLSSAYNGDLAEQDYQLQMSADLQNQAGVWVTTDGAWSLQNGHGVLGKVFSDCTPIRNENYTLSGEGHWLTPGQIGTGGEGEGFFTFTPMTGPPILSITVNAHRTYSDSCLPLGGEDYLGLAWPETCALEDVEAIPCDVTWLPLQEYPLGWSPEEGDGTWRKVVQPPASPGMVNITTDVVLVQFVPTP